jgi:hypothetical protein
VSKSSVLFVNQRLKRFMLETLRIGNHEITTTYSLLQIMYNSKR